ncbi:MAG: DUF4124 domain-containing protein [bacterium]
MLSEKFNLINLIGFLIIFEIILAWGNTTAGSKIYKWTDGQGHVHYSENPQGIVKQSWVEKSKSSKSVDDLLAAGQWYGYYNLNP